MTAARKADGRVARLERSVGTASAAPRDAVLRRVLVGGDVVALAATWMLVLGTLHAYHGSVTGLLAAIAGITVVSLTLLASQQLYLARVCRLRTVEVSRVIRVSVMTALLVDLTGPRWGVHTDVRRTAVGAVVMTLSLSLMRSLYTTWLRSRRAGGRHNRPVVVVGSREETESIQRLLEAHPELGFDAVVTVGPAADLKQVLADHHSDTVVVAVGGLSSVELNRVTRRLLANGIHVHLSTGLAGFDHRRLRAQPLAREPMFYVEPLRISPWHQTAKRAMDILGGTIGLLLALPVLLVAAVAIIVEDRGPVLFRHVRIGRNGEEFTVLKLRTMVPNAHRQLHLVAASNQRTGPLFKSHHDPRVTRVGRVLRATSIDELPQLINVLMGSMSLVGPRPALPHEVAQFDDELRARERVRPGITGLWQVEGRDDPSFDAYRRLDLFYVENWSLELDLVILLSTAQAVLGQTMRDLRKQWKPVRVSRNNGHVLDLTTPEVHVLDLAAPAVDVSP
ncbi:MAG TPA: sugar transferase [Acidimicrobiales bacterium]|nr:sugar transferase [Acidimicrobiales bacterium]